MRPQPRWIEVTDEQAVFGMLHRPENESRGLVLVLHGFTGSHIGTMYYFADVAERLCEAGFTVFRFDHRGSGNSDGDFADQRLATMREDANTVINALAADDIEPAPLGVIGHSMGTSTALVLTADRDIDALALWSPVADYNILWGAQKDEVAQNEEMTHFGFRFSTDKFAELYAYDFRDAISDVSAPVLIMHGTADEAVPQHHAEKLAAAGPNASLELLDGADHVFEDVTARERLLAETTVFFEDHL